MIFLVKFIFRGLLFLLLLAFFAHAYASPQAIDGIAAVVNESIITERQVQVEMRNIVAQMHLAHLPVPSEKVLHTKVLDSLIDKELQLQVAKMGAVNVEDATVHQAIADIAARNHVSVEILKEKLAAQGVDFANYFKDIREQMIISQVQRSQLSSNITISDDEVKQIEAKIKPMRAEGSQRYHLIDIFVPLPENASPDALKAAKGKVDKCLSDIRSGVDFSQLAIAAALESHIPAGGDFGWRTINQLPDIFAQNIQKMSSGQVMGPISASNGFHIIKLLGIEGVDNARHHSKQTHVRHILIKTDKTTNDEIAKMRLLKLKEKLQKEGNFAEMANANSQDHLSNTKGGELNWVSEGILDPAFEQVMDHLKIGQIGGPVKTHFGWHLIQVLGRRQVDDTKDMLLNQARNLAYQQKVLQSLPGWLQQLRSTAYVKKYS